MKRWLAALLPLLASPLCAGPVTRALLVGIDDYAPEVDADLKGAVNDVRLVHASLKAAHGLALDPLPAGAACEAGGEKSVALLNACATRANILARFDALVKASAPGDQLLFYFAGHGARSGFSADGTQSSGRHSTLVAADSRTKRADGDLVDDILDTVLKARIDEAAAHGVRVLTIFDSCNSGTATRSAGVQSRWVEPAPASAADADAWRPRVPPPGVSRVVPIHLAAALDGQKALERDGEGGRHGQFSLALTQEAAANPAATYGEIMHAVRARVTGQTPVGEGPLAITPFLGRGGGSDARLLSAEVRADDLLIYDGLLSGVRPGSVFRVHGSAADALAGTKPLGLARVVEATAQAARLRPVPPGLAAGNRLPPGLAAGNALPPGLAAGGAVSLVEVARGVDERPVSVRFEGVLPGDALDGLSVVEVRDGPADFVVAKGQDGRLELRGADGARIADLSRIAAADDEVRIAEALRRVANATALLTLPHKPGGSRFGVLALTEDGCADCRVLRGVDDAQGPAVRAGARFRLLIENRAGKRLYPYLFEVTPQYGINRLYPPGSASDALAADGFFHVGEAVRAARPGDFRLVLILSETALNAGPLEQGSLPRSTGCTEAHPLAKLLCAAGRGTRAADALPSGDFDVVTMQVRIEPAMEGER